MNISLRDYQDFLLLWVKKRTKVHLENLVIYPAMVRHCLCCHKSRQYSFETNGLCDACLADQTCTKCKQAFTPTKESVGTYCEGCWAAVEETWTRTFQEKDPVSAESSLRAFVTGVRPRLTGCSHVG